MKYIALILLTGLISLVTGCSVLSPVKYKPESIYELNALPKHVAAESMHPAVLLVMEPDSRPAYNTTQMAYSIKPYQIAYFVENRWAETPAKMLQPLIVQTLQNTHYFRTVVTTPFSGSYDYLLTSQLLLLQQNFTYQPALLQMKLRIQLMSAKDNRVIATQQLTIEEPIIQNTPYGGVVAANRAVEKMLKQIARFCVTKAR